MTREKKKQKGQQTRRERKLTACPSYTFPPCKLQSCMAEKRDGQLKRAGELMVREMGGVKEEN